MRYDEDDGGWHYVDDKRRKAFDFTELAAEGLGQGEDSDTASEAESAF